MVGGESYTGSEGEPLDDGVADDAATEDLADLTDTSEAEPVAGEESAAGTTPPPAFPNGSPVALHPRGAMPPHSHLAFRAPRPGGNPPPVPIPVAGGTSNMPRGTTPPPGPGNNSGPYPR